MSVFLTKLTLLGKLSTLSNTNNIASGKSFKLLCQSFLTISTQSDINYHQFKTFSTINYETKNRLAYITLNKPEVLNAIDGLMPKELSECVAKANDDPSVHVIVLAGAGKAFCSGYDLTYYAQNKNENAVQEMPWDSMKDYTSMKKNTEYFMSLFHSSKPTLCKIHGDALAGGSDIALCCDIILMANDARIGYMPARVWGCPTTAMWIYRLGIEKAKRMLLTGDKINGIEAEKLGLVLKSVPQEQLNDEVERLAQRMATVPINQLVMQKLVINQTLESMGLRTSQMFATLFDGIARHSPEGLVFKRRSETAGWKIAVKERDHGTYDWTADMPIEMEKRHNDDKL
ncbi:unnamed protein product [Rotaria magnacalcarata]|uniref:Enoyl-CoA hydratase n=4 Tax=Rotaria magnacalcarata TaxID=392030 RepID=A0A814SZH3_9BILA|nr:unnamed protein product [Rotaria magnacalcarata]CAF1680451.1 unnamed protein product [Rotaria magnacalcarata]CAF3752252.1 unnamed protein product [Rotaria magnacalcarata]CAF3830915.1 unnamed protein product [Rotaria magnacalcarata]